MPKFVIEKRDFLKGLSISEEIGGFFSDMLGINVYSQTDIGVLQNGSTAVTVYSEASSTALTSPVTQLVQYSDSAIQAVLVLSNDHAVRIRVNANDSEDVSSVVTFTGSNNADKTGAALYHLGSTSNSDMGVFYSVGSNIGVYETRGGTIPGTFQEEEFDADFMSTLPSGATTIADLRFRTMYWHKKQDILYFNDDAGTGITKGNQVSKYDANIGGFGTLTRNALDLPENWEIRDFGALRDYLAILAVDPVSGGSDDEFIQFRSKIFFWDGINDSWNYETPTINDQIIRLINTENGLFGIGKGDGVSYYQFELEQAKRLFNFPGNIDITAGRRDGNDLAHSGAITSIGNQLFFLGKHNEDGHIFSYNNRFAIRPTTVLNKTAILKTDTDSGVIDLGDLVAITPTKFYASFTDTGESTNQYRVLRFSAGNVPTDDARADTVELDSYFGGIGSLKRLKSIRFDIHRLSGGDVLEVYKELDYAGSWTRLDGGASASATNSIRESDFSGENRVTIKFTRADMFRHLRLRFDWTGGNVKIRRIVIDFENAEE